MDIKRILEATRFAAHKHKDQRRKDHAASPYIVHPIAAAELLIEAGVTDEDTVIAAILHDTIEDTETTRDEIAEQFGEEIGALVEEVTVIDTGVKKVDKQREIDDASLLSTKAALVRTADKICNMRDVLTDTPKGWSEERRNYYFIWAQKVLKAANAQNSYLQEALREVISKGEVKFSTDLSVETVYIFKDQS